MTLTPLQVLFRPLINHTVTFKLCSKCFLNGTVMILSFEIDRLEQTMYIDPDQTAPICIFLKLCSMVKPYCSKRIQQFLGCLKFSDFYGTYEPHHAKMCLPEFSTR